MAFGHGGHGAVLTIAAGSCRLDAGSSQVSAAWAEGTVLQRGASQTPSAPCPPPSAPGPDGHALTPKGSVVLLLTSALPCDSQFLTEA